MRRIIFIVALILCFLDAKPQKIDIQMSTHTFTLNDSISFSVCNTDSLDVFFNVQLEKKKRGEKYVLYTEDVFNSAYGKSIVLCLKPNGHSRLSFKLRNQVLYYMKSSRLLKSLQIERSLLSLYCKNQDKHSSHVRSTGQRYNKI